MFEAARVRIEKQPHPPIQTTDKTVLTLMTCAWLEAKGEVSLRVKT